MSTLSDTTENESRFGRSLSFQTAVRKRQPHFGVHPMYQAFVITLREGLEAFLIVAISLAYLRKSGRKELVPAVHWGIGIAAVLSIGAALLFQRARNQALWESILYFAAAISVATLTVHMWRTAKRIKRDIEGHLRHSTLKPVRPPFSASSASRC